MPPSELFNLLMAGHFLSQLKNLTLDSMTGLYLFSVGGFSDQTKFIFSTERAFVSKKDLEGKSMRFTVGEIRKIT